MTNKQGVFETSEENYSNLEAMYKKIITKISNETFEEFCGNMAIAGCRQLNSGFNEVINRSK